MVVNCLLYFSLSTSQASMKSWSICMVKHKSPFFIIGNKAMPVLSLVGFLVVVVCCRQSTAPLEKTFYTFVKKVVGICLPSLVLRKFLSNHDFIATSGHYLAPVNGSKCEVKTNWSALQTNESDELTFLISHILLQFRKLSNNLLNSYFFKVIGVKKM